MELSDVFPAERIVTCPHCGNEDQDLLPLVAFVSVESTGDIKQETYHCEVCAKDFTIRV